LHLPARPEWLTIFEPSGTAAPKLPWVAHQGRDHTKPTASPEATAKPTEPSTEHLMLVQDGCERHGKGFIELGGGEERVVGTDKPSRSKLPPEHDIQPPIHVRVRNEAKTIVFEALDPQRLPLVDGKPAAKGELALGDTITIGNRVFAIAGAKQEQAIETPVKECPEFAMKDPAPPR
jgi:hypothetical protein